MSRISESVTSLGGVVTVTPQVKVKTERNEDTPRAKVKTERNEDTPQTKVKTERNEDTPQAKVKTERNEDTPQAKVKTERIEEDIVEGGGRILRSRFDVVDNHPDVYTKQETDDEASTASSRFSAVSGADEAPAQAGQKADESPASDEPCEPSAEPPEEVAVKEEPTIYEIQQRSAKHARVYGDRDLLARQSKEGMMKLGGGNQASELWPKSDEARMKRLDGKLAMGYNSRW